MNVKVVFAADVLACKGAKVDFVEPERSEVRRGKGREGRGEEVSVGLTMGYRNEERREAKRTRPAPDDQSSRTA